MYHKFKPFFKWFLVPFLFLLLLLLGALFNDSWILYRAAYFLALGAIFAFLWVRLNDPSSVQVNFQASAKEVQAGNSVEIAISAQNSSEFPRLWLNIYLPASVPGASFQHVVSLRGYDAKRWSLTTPPLKRGLYTVGPPEISATDALLVPGRTQLQQQTRQILVYPRTEDLPYFDPFLSQTQAIPVSRNAWSSTSYQVGGIRPYVYGDSLRRVHWPSSARTGKLMVKVLDAASTRQLWLVLDMQEEIHSRDGASEECLVTAAASAAKKLLTTGLAVGLLYYGSERHVVAPGRGGEQLWNILRSLAAVKPEGKVPVVEVIRREKPILTHGFSIILFTPAIKPPLLPVLGELRSDGCRAKVVLWEASGLETGLSAFDPAGELRQVGVATYRIKAGQPLSQALDDSRSELPFAVSRQ